MAIPSLKQWLFVARALREHGRRRRWAYALAGAAFIWCDSHYRLALNMSDSLPGAMYLVALGTRPAAVGDYVAFEWRRDQFYRPDRVFIKRVAGLPGQAVAVRSRAVFIDGKPVGYAKPRSGQGVALRPIATGVIPAGAIYAAAPHPDSLDSRYSVTGLIEASRIVGKAYAIF